MPAVMKKVAHETPAPVKEDMFIPKIEVTKESGKNTNAKKVTRDTESACESDFRDSWRERSPTWS